MNPSIAVTPEVRSLMEAVCDGMADDAQVRDLESLLSTDDEACKFYVDLLNLDAELQWLADTRQEGVAAVKRLIAAEQAPLQHPPLSFLTTTLRGTLGCFPDGMPLAYLIATVVTGLGLLVGRTSICPVLNRLPALRCHRQLLNRRGSCREDHRHGRLQVGKRGIRDWGLGTREGFKDCKSEISRCSRRPVRPCLRFDGNYVQHGGQGHCAGTGDV